MTTQQHSPIHPAIPALYPEKHKSRLPYSRLRPMTVQQPQPQPQNGHLRSRSSPASTNSSYSTNYFSSPLVSSSSSTSVDNLTSPDFAGPGVADLGLARSTLAQEYGSSSFGMMDTELEKDTTANPSSVETPQEDENTQPFPQPVLSPQHHPISRPQTPTTPSRRPQLQHSNTSSTRTNITSPDTPPKKERDKERSKGKKKGERWGIAIYILLSLHLLLVFVSVVAWLGRMGSQGVGQGCAPVSLVGFIGEGNREVGSGVWEGVKLGDEMVRFEDDEDEDEDSEGEETEMEDTVEIVWS